MGEEMVSEMNSVIVKATDKLDEMWAGECRWLLKAAKGLMLSSAITAFFLCALMIWLSLANRHTKDHIQHRAGYGFVWGTTMGAFFPLLYILRRKIRNRWREDDASSVDFPERKHSLLLQPLLQSDP